VKAQFFNGLLGVQTRRRGELGVLRGEVALDRVKEPTGLFEADWTEVKIYLGSVLTSVWLFVMRLRFSGALYVRGYPLPSRYPDQNLKRGFDPVNRFCRDTSLSSPTPCHQLLAADDLQVWLAAANVRRPAVLPTGRLLNRDNTVETPRHPLCGVQHPIRNPRPKGRVAMVVPRAG
jgi:hypothetical protein